MIQTILFDLDNTLILFDEVKFFKAYIKKVAPLMEDIIPPHQLWKMVLDATKAVLHNNGQLTNKEVFNQTFSRRLKDQTEEIWNRFIHFYQNEFDTLRTLVRVNQGVSDIFSLLFKKNFKIVIASNPFWPRVAMEKRMGWAGVTKEQVCLITHMENMHFCKPRLEYYQEICQIINEDPKNCLMVGDDPMNDMVAGQIGMKTYLTRDHEKYRNQLQLISQKIRFGFGQNKTKIKSDYNGSLSQLLDRLPKIKNDSFFEIK